MKSITTIFVLCCAPFLGFAQSTSTSQDYNNADATISNSGTVFNDHQNGAPGYEIPKGGGNHPIFSAQFWFAGVDANNNLHTTLGGVDNGGTDIDQGPYSTTNAYSDPSYDEPFMVSICQEDIDAFNLWWECSNGVTTVGCANATQPSAAVLNSIYNWPAHGDISIGQDYYLIPFFDRDGDGNYDPINQGDHPVIKGCCATYMIQNDVGNVHTYSGTDPIGIETLYMFYQFGANPDLYNTTFVDVRTINRGTTDYPEFAHGFMVDADLGYSDDDYFGSDSLTSTMIFYNADNLDEGAYLSNPPAIGITALETPITSAMSYGFFPSSAAETWNIMNGLQPSGAAFIDPNGSSTKFLLNGDPNDPSDWNEASQGYVAGDRKGIMSTNQGAFNAGDTAFQTYAIVYSEGGNHLENASNVINLASWAKTFYDTEINDGCDAGGILGTEEISLENVLIYPNPSNGEFTISIPDGQLQSLEIFTLAGKAVNCEVQTTGSAVEVDLHEKASGVYLVQIVTDNGSVTKRLIVE